MLRAPVRGQPTNARGRAELPRAPVEIQEAVELYAREHGRAGRIDFKPEEVLEVELDGNKQRFRVGLNCWEASFTLRANDKALLAWQQGLAAEPPRESVLFIEDNPDAGKSDGRGGRQGAQRALNIYQMGASGVRAFLDKGNTWSGQGEFASVSDAVRNASAKNEQASEKNYASARDDVKARAREEHVWYGKKPHEKIARQVVATDLSPNRNRE